MKEIRWHGRGGQGAFTASKILGAAAVLDGRYALAFPSFGPERRGAPIQAFTKISDKPIINRSTIKKCDYIIYLDETLYCEDAVLDLKEGGLVLVNSRQPNKYTHKNVLAVDADAISEAILKRPVSNTAMLSALTVASGITARESVKKALAFYLPAKIVPKNEELVDTVAEHLQEWRSL